MSGIPRTGLFSRNHVTTLAQRNRVLSSNNGENVQNSNNSNDYEKDNGAGVISNNSNSGSNIDSPSSSFASLPRDPEGFDDLDAYFNRASTPQKTPKSTRKSNPTSKLGTPSSNRKTASVLVAKPLKMISSKIAEHYKKEPRLAVSMTEALEQQQESEAQGSEEPEVHESEVQEQQEPEVLEQEVLSISEDRLLRAKRELEEMSINSSFESVIEVNNEKSVDTKDSGTVTAEDVGYVKSQLSSLTTAPVYDDYQVPDDDTLMDRLVEEMLVNDSDIPEPVVTEVREDVNPTAVKKTRKPAGSRKGASQGLTRRPLTYLPGAEYTETGQRRSCRLKLEPLRYWANEKVCYGRADDPSITLPVIVNVIKKPELDDPTFAMGLTRKRKRPAGDGNVSKLKAQAFGPDCDVETEVNCYDRPGDEEVRLVALSHHHVQGDPVKDCSFRIHTIFTEGTYMSSGQLIFPPESSKPTKNSARHALVFYVITGSFRVEINKESFVIGPGGQFHVPRANHYTITHISSDRTVEGRLFFCHCKDNAE